MTGIWVVIVFATMLPSLVFAAILCAPRGKWAHLTAGTLFFALASIAGYATWDAPNDLHGNGYLLGYLQILALFTLLAMTWRLLRHFAFPYMAQRTYSLGGLTLLGAGLLAFAFLIGIV